jgi:hypothetical protein
VNKLVDEARAKFLDMHGDILPRKSKAVRYPTNSCPDVGPMSARCRPDVGPMSARCLPDVGLMSARRLPDVSPMSARCHPDVMAGS